jgi:hypothetical protein
MDSSGKTEGNYHGQRETMWFQWKEGTMFHYHSPEKEETVTAMEIPWKSATQKMLNLSCRKANGHQGILLMEWLFTGITVDIDGYCEILTRLWHRIQQ